jgi:alpha-tubulin suppressor-like RCC1 family protein
MMIRRALSLVALTAAASLAACDEDELTGPGYVCDVTNPVRDVIVSPRDAQVLVHSPALATDTLVVFAVATSRNGTARSEIPIKFESSDNSVATVTDAGVVRAHKPGTVRITASACGQSSTTLITVVPNVVSVSVIPGSDTVVAGDSVTFSAVAFGQGSAPIRNVKFTFTASGAGVTVVPQGDTAATIVTPPGFSGNVTVTATGDGVAGTASLLVLPRVFLAGSLSSTGGLDAGDDDACGIISTGQLFCWGLNIRGQLGAASDSTCFPGVELGEAVADTVAVTNKPCTLSPKRVAPTLAFSAVSAGDSTTCGLTTAGVAYCWGGGKHGEIGNGNVADQAAPVRVGGAHAFASISVGGSHSCALTATGAAWCWGNDLDGQLGDDRLVHSTTPIPVSGGTVQAVFASISAGFRHTCALSSAGVAFCWGNNEYGQLGIGTVGGPGDYRDFPVAVQTALRFQSISAGGDHTCGITTTGAAVCWGSNGSGQLGLGTIGGNVGAPGTAVAGLTFSKISASSGSATINPESPLGLPYKVARGHTCGLTTGGAIYCWGDNDDLQLGRGPTSGFGTTSGVPVQVTGGGLPAGVTFTSVTTGVRTGCGVGSDGAAYCWGANIYGALGNTLQAAFRGLPQRVATP